MAGRVRLGSVSTSISLRVYKQVTREKKRKKEDVRVTRVAAASENSGILRLTAWRAEDGRQRIEFRYEVHHRAERILHRRAPELPIPGSFGGLAGNQSAAHDASRFFRGAFSFSGTKRDATSHEGGGRRKGGRCVHSEDSFTEVLFACPSVTRRESAF